MKPDQYEKAKQVYEKLKNSKGIIESIKAIWSALDQSWSSGYRCAVNNKRQEQFVPICEHISDGLQYLSNPPKYRCVSCRQFYRGNV